MTGDKILLKINLCLCCFFNDKLYNERHESNGEKKHLTVRRTEKPILCAGTYRQASVFNIHDSNKDRSTGSVSSLCQRPPSIQLVKGSPM